MTTISTGGYSTRDASMGGQPAHILWIATVFMILGAMPFVAFLKAIVFRNLRRAYDPQIPVLLCIIAALALMVAVWGYGSFADQAFAALTHATFNIVSVVTTTGYGSQDYAHWSPFATGVFLLAMFLGGAAGSTSGGLKTYRLIIMFQLVSTSLKQLLMPHGVFPIVYNERLVDIRILTSVAVFLSAFFAVLMLLTVMLAATGLDLVTAFSGALTALTNVGPGLGNVIGPAGNFSSLSDTAKFLMSVGMIMGRLEIISVLVLLSPAFWQFGLGRERFAGFR
jgi:trk system potassium uptake protein TrkH